MAHDDDAPLFRGGEAHALQVEPFGRCVRVDARFLDSCQGVVGGFYADVAYVEAVLVGLDRKSVV